MKKSIIFIFFIKEKNKMIKSLIKQITPDYIKSYLRKKNQIKHSKYMEGLIPLDEKNFYEILINNLGIEKGDTLFIHSSTAKLKLSFPIYNIIPMILEIVGEKGTILFPAYPKLNSYEFLKSGLLFDIKKSVSYTGILTEFARRHSKAIRSIHPTKSVVAIGGNAEYLTANHQLSPYPYDINSPYFRITEFNGKVIGLGVKTTYLSCVHCVEDFFKNKFPVSPYHKRLFEAPCIGYNGKTEIVRTYAHIIDKMDFNLPEYFKKYIPKEICQDININGMNFFRSDAKSMIDKMIELVDDNITIYKKRHYKLNYMFK